MLSDNSTSLWMVWNIFIRVLQNYSHEHLKNTYLWHLVLL